MKRIDLETKLGGIFGMVALIAIIYEASLGGFSPEATAGAVKDIAGTLVAILVLVVAVRKIRPRKSKETFHSVLHEELEDLERRAQPLIHRAKDYSDGIRYYLITRLERVLYATADDLKEIKEKGSVNSGVFNGKFFDVFTEGELKVHFYLNASTFKDRAKLEGKSNEAVLTELGPVIANCINKQSHDKYQATPTKDGKTITVIFDTGKEQQDKTPEDAREVAKLINYVLTLYTIAS